MAVNYAKKFSKIVDEKFDRESIAPLATNKEFDWKGVKTITLSRIPTAPMGAYKRTGKDRYGTPTDLGNEVQDLTLTQDRAFTFVIDRGDKNETEMTMDAGKALDRQLKLVVYPEYDKYVFTKMATVACAASQNDTTAATKSNAYELLLKGQEALGNANVPDVGRVCLCSYGFANKLKQDPAFNVGGDVNMNMKTRGVMGEVDGTTIVKVPASRLPAQCDFILVHPIACSAPKTLESYRVHEDPPGISGWSTSSGQRVA